MRRDAFASVWTDNADIGRIAAEHLLARGEWKSAGYVHEHGLPFYSTERLSAFRARMKRAGLATAAFPEHADAPERLPPERFLDRLREWVRDLPKPAAVMACSDMRAADVINACRAEGLSVPQQVAVVGVDNNVTQHARCGTTIRKAIEDARLEEAQSRLQRGATVRDIVATLHFTSANQFYRIYKRHFGHTLRQTDG